MTTAARWGTTTTTERQTMTTRTPSAVTARPNDLKAPAQAVTDPTPAGRRLTARDHRAFEARLALLAAGVVAGEYVAFGSHRWWVMLTAATLLGMCIAHGVELAHQALHGTGLRGRRANRLAGVALCTPMLVNYSEYQRTHLRHHRTLGTPEDTEFFNYFRGDGRAAPLSVLRSTFNVERWAGAVCTSLRDSLRPSVGAHERRRRIDSAVLAVYLVAFVGLVATGHAVTVLWAWLVPLAVAEPVHFLIELPEHLGCDGDDKDVFQNTRSIRSGPMAAWFTNGNNFHVEHHQAMGVPMHRLRNLYDGNVGRHGHHADTYRQFLLQQAGRNNHPRATRAVTDGE
jgi:fatty acid desaturase